MFLLRLATLCSTCVLVLFVDDLHHSADVDVVHLGDGQVNESLGVHDLHGVPFYELELHDDHVVLYVLQVNVLRVDSLCWIDRLAFHHVEHLLLVLALYKKLVPIVCLLVDAVEIEGVLDWDELGD